MTTKALPDLARLAVTMGLQVILKLTASLLAGCEV
jgi:hypothetical protein